MADVDTSEQKHKGKEEQNKAGTERHLQDDGQRLDEAIRDHHREELQDHPGQHRHSQPQPGQHRQVSQ